jgi:hypothetical protein
MNDETMEGYSIRLNIIWLSLLDLNKNIRFYKVCKSFFSGLCLWQIFQMAGKPRCGVPVRQDGMMGHKSTADLRPAGKRMRRG